MSSRYPNTDLFGEFDRLQRQIESLFGGFPSSLRSARVGAFPPINVGSTDDSIEVVAFAPGLDPRPTSTSRSKRDCSQSVESVSPLSSTMAARSVRMRRNALRVPSGVLSSFLNMPTPTRCRPVTPMDA